MSPCRRYNLMGTTHLDRCHWLDCPQGNAHHPHDWARTIDDNEWDWIDYLNSASAREREDLECGVCHESWPCSTKREHVAARAIAKRERPMQAKDIPSRSVLESVKRHDDRGSIYQIWDDFPDVPFKVLRAKMDKLGKQRLVNCCCNECSGRIGLTQEGAAMLAPKHIYVIAEPPQ